ncbi:toprim domain-containing protein [Burkholderia vietnamiensis]|uniref:toprim domain-containing protein n=1 Tax=Burkholderia vietnamiensis TaxID=60552 RepID=UPI001CF38B74|nr:toprim domain-containing protein [Burkholderia vietnamiensis]MCA8391485.1 toprim domain-containing protein [Burkholderia vietnamiensis]HDR8957048.1 toprim domain-containing protein [Burkholderia vietnamiensis]HDR9243677.1 toprim domain-containing protein [Burkholderia vietnamiensis]
MNARELAELMAQNAQAIVEHLLPNGRKSGKEWKSGSTAGEKGQSLSVCLSGAKRGVWKDFASGEAGDLLDLWCACRSLSVADAMREAKQFLGVRDDMPKRQAPTYQRPARPKATRPTSLLDEWFGGRGITAETVQAFKVAEQTNGPKTHIVFPYLRGGELINAKYRNIADKKDMRQEAGAEPCLFGWNLIDPAQRVVAIAEGEIDAMTLHQVGIPALSVNAGAGNHQWIDSDWERLERFSEILLCYDNDEAGRKGAQEVANRLGIERCRVVFFGESKDANEYLLAGARAEDFRRCCDQASGFDPDELKSIDRFWSNVKSMFYPAHEESNFPYLSFCGRNELWFEFRPGEVTVWTGINGHGKSLLLGQVLIGLMCQGERACVFSGEMRPEMQGKRLAKQLGGLDRPAPEYLDHMGAWLRDRMWVFDLVGVAAIERLVTVFTYGFKRYGIRHFVIDSLMMTDVPEDGHGAMTAQKEAMRLLANFARQYNVHVHLVAHPRKGQDEKRSPGKMDVGGSGKITDAADNVFSVWSAQKDQDDESVDEPDAFLTLLKARNGETQRRSLALFFNRECMQFGPSESRRPYVYLPFSRAGQEAEA